MNDYTKPAIWNTVWNRPYRNYEKHHQLFWQKIRDHARGRILDLACGSASCWIGSDLDITGVDFSEAAIREARKNVPVGGFFVEKLPTDKFDNEKFDTVVLSGLVNYYHDLKPFVDMVQRVLKPQGRVLITINVVKDFSDREWNIMRIQKEFGSLGSIQCWWEDNIGWFIKIVAP